MAYSSNLRRSVRLLVPDTEAIYGDDGDEYIFDDNDIDLYLGLGHGNAQWAAGLACLAVGGSEAIVGKVIRNYETETDASKLLKEWTAKGKLLIEVGRLEYEADSYGFFEVAYFDDDDVHMEGENGIGYPWENWA